MPLIAEITLSENLILFEETFERVPEARCVFEDFHYVTDDGGTHYVFFWWVSGTEPDAFDEGLRADPTVTGFRKFFEFDDRHLYRVETKSFPSNQPLVFPTYREKGITEVESVRDADGLRLKARFPSRETLGEFVETCEKIADNAEVNRLYVERHKEPTERDGAPSLTTKQRDALSAALERGYFETPSDVTLKDLAEEFDVTPQTLSTHIRVGVRKLVEESLGTDT